VGPPQPPPTFPAAFGGYTLLAQLGQGGMAEVFLARKKGPAGFSKLVVIKRILPHLAREPEFITMFLDEARLAAQLEHPNVVQVFDMGEEQGSYYLAMEYLGGETFAGIARRAKQLQVPVGATVAARIIAEACEGLHYAHEFRDSKGVALDIIHRDVSPQNLFVTYDGRVKVLDFGVAKAATRLAHTDTGQIKGKASYMSPEQCRGDPVTRRSDVFSLGVVLLEMISGRRVFKADQPFAVVMAIGSGNFPNLRELAGDAPAPLVEVCERALAFDPAKRFATAKEMRAAIDAHFKAAGIDPGPERTAQLMGRLFADDIARRAEALRSDDDQSQVFSVLADGESGSASSPSLGPLARTVTTWGKEGPPPKVPPRPRAPALFALAAAGLLAGVAAAFAAGVVPVPRFTSGAPIRVGEFGFSEGPADLATLTGALEELGRPLDVITLPADQAIEQLRTGRVDVLRANAEMVAKLKEALPSLRPLALIQAQGSTVYQGVMVTRLDSGLKTLQDLQGKTVCWKTLTSNSGYFYPRKLMRQAGIDPDRFFGKVIFGGTHLKNLENVRDGVCDVAALTAHALYSPPDPSLRPGVFQIIATTEAIPQDMVLARGELPDAERDAIQRALLLASPTSELAKDRVKRGSKVEGFVNVKDEDYAGVLAVVREERAAQAARDGSQ